MANAEWLADELEMRGLNVVSPTLPLVAAELPKPLFRDLRAEGWRIARTATGKLRIVCMPHVTRATLATFLEDFDRLEEAIT